MHEPRLLMVWVMTLAAALVAGRASGQDPAIALDPPPAGVFVIDHAEMLDAAQRQTLETLGRTLLEENQTPLVVVTIESMSAHWPHGDIRIETFAHLLFDQWEIGIADLAGETWNTGILLLVSKGDRRARIQLGAGWGRDKDRECSRIMDRTIIPQFKRGRFGDGIVKGAEALDAMARGRALPAGASAQGSGAAPRAGSGASPRRSSRVAGMMPIIGCFGLIVLVGIIGVALVTIKQMRGDQSHKSYRSLDERDDGEDDDEDEGGGRKGLGFWSGWLAGQLLSSGRGGSSGGGFFGGRGYSSGSRGGLGGGGFSGGGGSSGGGFSGGGGASGGW